MKTSYFANLKNVSNPLSIASKPPSWYSGPEFKVLAPNWSFLSAYKAKEIDAYTYSLEYQRLVLSPLDPREVYDILVNQYGPDVTLLCYERSGEFCHRRLVAGWFAWHLKVKVRELKTA
jgi:hypothetical protein